MRCGTRFPARPRCGAPTSALPAGTVRRVSRPSGRAGATVVPGVVVPGVVVPGVVVPGVVGVGASVVAGDDGTVVAPPPVPPAAPGGVLVGVVVVVGVVPSVNSKASTSRSSTAWSVVNRMITSRTPAYGTGGVATVMRVPEASARTDVDQESPNQTYTGTVVGKAPSIVTSVPPAVLPARGVIDVARYPPSVTGSGAGIVDAGGVHTGAAVVVVAPPAGAVVTVPAGTVVVGAVVPGVVGAFVVGVVVEGTVDGGGGRRGGGRGRSGREGRGGRRSAATADTAVTATTAAATGRAGRLGRGGRCGVRRCARRERRRRARCHRGVGHTWRERGGRRRVGRVRRVGHGDRDEVGDRRRDRQSARVDELGDERVLRRRERDGRVDRHAGRERRCVHRDRWELPALVGDERAEVDAVDGAERGVESAHGADGSAVARRHGQTERDGGGRVTCGDGPREGRGGVGHEPVGAGEGDGERRDRCRWHVADGRGDVEARSRAGAPGGRDQPAAHVGRRASGAGREHGRGRPGHGRCRHRRAVQEAPAGRGQRRHDRPARRVDRERAARVGEVRAGVAVRRRSDRDHVVVHRGEARRPHGARRDVDAVVAHRGHDRDPGPTGGGDGRFEVGNVCAWRAGAGAERHVDHVGVARRVRDGRRQ